MAMIGADVEALRELAREFDRVSNALESSVMVPIRRSLSTAPWRGRNAEEFKALWMRQLQPSLRSVASELSKAAKTLRRNADAQAEASSAVGNSPVGGGNGTRSGSPIGFCKVPDNVTWHDGANRAFGEYEKWTSWRWLLSGPEVTYNSAFLWAVKNKPFVDAFWKGGMLKRFAGDTVRLSFENLGDKIPVAKLFPKHAGKLADLGGKAATTAGRLVKGVGVASFGIEVIQTGVKLSDPKVDLVDKGLSVVKAAGSAMQLSSNPVAFLGGTGIKAAGIIGEEIRKFDPTLPEGVSFLDAVAGKKLDENPIKATGEVIAGGAKAIGNAIFDVGKRLLG